MVVSNARIDTRFHTWSECTIVKESFPTGLKNREPTSKGTGWATRHCTATCDGYESFE